MSIENSSKEYEFTQAQRRIYLQELRFPNTSININACSSVYFEAIDHEKMRAAIRQHIFENPSLRMKIVKLGDAPRYVIAESIDFQIPFLDFSNPNERKKLNRDLKFSISGEDDSTEKTAISNFANEPFSLRSGEPLFRFALFKCNDGSTGVISSFHHLISDGVSVGLNLKRLADIYQSLISAQKLRALRIQDYQSFVGWENSYLASQEYREDAKFWNQKMSALSEVATIPPGSQTFTEGSHTASIDFNFSADLISKLKDALNTKVSTALLTAFAILVSKLTQKPTFSIGFPVHNRLSKSIVFANGVVANVIPLLINVPDGCKLKDWVPHHVEPMLGQSIKHGRYSSLNIWEDVKDHSSAERLFDIMFDFQVQKPRAEEQGYVELIPNTTQLNSLTVKCVQFGGKKSGVNVTFMYHTAKYAANDMKRIFSQWQTLIQSVIASPDAQIEKLSLAPPHDIQKICGAFNDTKYTLTPEKNLVELISNNLNTHPELASALFSSTSISNAELERKSSLLGQSIKGVLEADNQPVALFLERSEALAIGILGILKSGSIYLPILPDTPKNRLAKILDNAMPRAIVTHRKYSPLLVEQGVDLPNVIFIEDALESDPVSRIPTLLLKNAPAPDDPAYLIYTSGTTGVPKGVLTSHAAMLNQLSWMQRTFKLTADDIVLHKTSIMFDVSLWELLWPLSTKASVSILAPGAHRNVLELQKHINSVGVTVLHFVPSMLRSFLEYSDTPCLNVRLIICSGEKLDSHLVKNYHRRFPNAELFNLYGPTEASIDVTAKDCTNLAGADELKVSIGKPIDNTIIHILDPQKNLCPIGVQGEIYIGGTGLATAYFNDRDLTKEKFIEVGLPHQTFPERLYRTGDLGRWTTSGEIECLGRIDTQVKVRGYRIELEEIETLISEYKSVIDCVVVAKELEDYRTVLIAYVQTLSTQDKFSNHDIPEIRDRLTASLPDYMTPTFIYKIDEIPLSSSGKKDRNRASMLALDVSRNVYIPSRNEAELAVVRVFEKVFNGAKVGVKDHFFDTLGGDSLLATSLAFELDSKFPDAAISINEVYEFSTPEQMTRRILTARKSKDRAASIVDVRHEADNILSRLRPADLSEVHKKNDFQSSDIFLTGSTGFVGAFVLNELLSQTDRNVFCLTRDASEASAKKRILSNLQAFNLSLPTSVEDRIIPLTGDISKPGLGLTQSNYHQVSQACAHIIHLAGQIDHHASYDYLYPTNVGSTEHIIKFCQDGQLKKLSYASTEDIFSYRSSYAKTKLRDENFDILTEQHSSSTGYAATKCVADQVFQGAIELGIEVLIFRFGIVTGDLSTGKMPAYQWIARMLKTSLEIERRFETPPGSDLDTRSFMTPVDFLSNALVRATLSSHFSNEIIHLSSAKAISWDHVLDQVEIINKRSIERVDIYEWLTICRNYLDEGKPLPIHPFIQKEMVMTKKEIDESVASRFRGGVNISAEKSLEKLSAFLNVEFPNMETYFKSYAKFTTTL